MNESRWTTEKVGKVLERFPIGQTQFQMRHFVVGDQVGLSRQIRQAVVEIDARERAIKKVEYNAKKSNLELKLLKEKYEKEKDSLSETEREIQENEIDYKSWKTLSADRTLEGYKRELSEMYDILEEITEGVDIDSMLENFNESENDYWAERLGKQAAIDIATTGRIGSGNLAAIQSLPEGVLESSLRHAITYSQKYVGSIQRQEQEVLQNPTLDKNLLGD